MPVEISISEDLQFYSVAVRDHGRGIQEKDRDKIFERFYRAPGSTAQGSGLGLSIAKQIAEIHGGDIVYQNSNPGSSFVIRIKKV